MKNTQKNYWLEHWENKKTYFHDTEVNKLLIKNWPALQLPPNSTVFVPLCGKSIDMLWLAKQGHGVIGVELSEIACETFFKENKLAYAKENYEKFICYFSTDLPLKIYCGDFFDLAPEMLSSVSGVYDRAALIALPEETRCRYAEHLQKILPPDCQILLISKVSPDTVKGPPFPIPPEEIQRIFHPRFITHELMRTPQTPLPEHLSLKGYRESTHVVYRLREI